MNHPAPRPLLAAVSLVVHAMKRQRLYPPSLADVEIGIFVPAHDKQEEVAHRIHRFGRQVIGGEGKATSSPPFSSARELSRSRTNSSTGP